MRLTAHLGIVVPEGVTIRVGRETRTWTEGGVLMWDDSFEHEVGFSTAMTAWKCGGDATFTSL